MGRSTTQNRTRSRIEHPTQGLTPAKPALQAKAEYGLEPSYHYQVLELNPKSMRSSRVENSVFDISLYTNVVGQIKPGIFPEFGENGPVERLLTVSSNPFLPTGEPACSADTLAQPYLSPAFFPF